MSFSVSRSTTSTHVPNRRRLKANNKDSDKHNDGSFRDRRHALLRNIKAIREPQRLYMKGVSHLLDKIDPVLLADHPENVRLWLPSDISQPMREDWCTQDLPQLEYRLRCALANGALQDIRRFRQFTQALTAKTRSHISNTQSTISRARGQFDRVQQKINNATATYRACRDAIVRLAPNEEFGEWKNTLQELRREDIWGPAREGSETSESHHISSWIWQTTHQGSVPEYDNEFHSALRVEWCRAQERAKRYEEEVQLVEEEMRRTLAFFVWLAHEWETRAAVPPVGYLGGDKTTIAGISAHARKQATVYHKLVNTYVSDWFECLETKSLGSSWLQQYPRPSCTRRHRLPSNVKLYHSKSAPTDTSTPDDVDFNLDSEDELNHTISSDHDLLEELTDS